MFTHKPHPLQKFCTVVGFWLLFTLAAPPTAIYAAHAPVPVDPCRYPDPQTSSITSASTAVEANGNTFSIITVRLNNALGCGAKATTTPTWVHLYSSRGALDTIMLAPNATNPTTTGSVTFWVKSSHAGSSSFWAEASTRYGVVTLYGKEKVAFYSCITGSLLPLGAKNITFNLTNAAANPWAWRLRELTIHWVSGSGQKVVTAALGPTGTIWQDASSAGAQNPLVLGPMTGGSTGWNSNNRDILAGTAEVLDIGFLKNLNSGQYNLTLMFENPSGGQHCAQTLSVTK